jgi:hypothetical protein
MLKSFKHANVGCGWLILYDVRYRELFSYLVLYFGDKTLGHAGGSRPRDGALFFWMGAGNSIANRRHICLSNERERERETERL